MRASHVEPRIAVITAGAVAIVGGAAVASYFLLRSVPDAWPPSGENIVPLAGTTILAAIVLGGLQLWIRRHASLRLTPEGLDVAVFWGRRQIPWHAVTAVRGNGTSGITIESTVCNLSLAVRLFRPTNGLIDALEHHVGKRAVELPRVED